jgi:hypothetical protein
MVTAQGAPDRWDGGVVDHIAARLRRPLDRAWFSRAGLLDALAGLGRDVQANAPPVTGPRVLVVPMRMWTHHAAHEAVIAHALRLRGADVAMLNCGGGQPICEVGWARRAAPRPCDRCGWFTERLARDAGYPLLRLADGLPWGPRGDRAPAAVAGATEEGDVSAAWFLKSADPDATALGPDVVRDFAVACEGVEVAAERALARWRPDVVVALNGLFAAEAVLKRVAEAVGIPVVTYEIAPRNGALVWGRGATAPDMDMDEIWADQRDRPLTDEQSLALDAMVLGRVSGETAHERYFERQLEEKQAVRAAIGAGPQTRVVTAFSNLVWDSALINKDIAYPSMFEWLADLARSVGDDTVLAIRVHPAETRWGTEQPVEHELRARIPDLPPNVRIVRPDEPISSYTLMELSDLACVYTTTVGLEATLRGVPVAVAGETHYRRRGFTWDLDRPQDLAPLLADPPTIDAERLELARRYAFGFFFRRMVPFGHVRGAEGAALAVVPGRAAELAPGADPLLDFVCSAILDGGDLHLPAELALQDSPAR